MHGTSNIKCILFTSTNSINQLVFVLASYCVIPEIGTGILHIVYLEYRIRGTSAKRMKLAFSRFVTAMFLVL